MYWGGSERASALARAAIGTYASAERLVFFLHRASGSYSAEVEFVVGTAQIAGLGTLSREAAQIALDFGRHELLNRHLVDGTRAGPSTVRAAGCGRRLGGVWAAAEAEGEQAGDDVRIHFGKQAITRGRRWYGVGMKSQSLGGCLRVQRNGLQPPLR